MSTFNSTLTVERLRELLNYDPETGVFIWLIDRSRVAKAGTVAGSLKDGYVKIMIDGKQYRSHRLVWLYVYGHWPDEQIDHKNGIRDDNRISNLRSATHSQNLQNAGAHRNNTSGYKGVCYDSFTKRWKAQCQKNGKTHNIGLFATAEMASEAYIRFAKNAHGEFFKC